MRITRQFGVLALGIAVVAPVCANPNIEEGNWEITVKMEIPGMPMAMPPITRSQCVTQKNAVPDTSQPGQTCVVKEQKVSGETVTWRTECKGREGTVDGEGRIKYAGKSYSGTMLAKMSPPGGEAMTVNYQMQGRHTGPCKADSKKATK